MYNTQFVCTYNTDKVFINFENINEKQKEFLQDEIYRQELLSILGLEEYDEEKMSIAIHDLYEKIKENIQLKECMINLASKFMSTDEETGLIIMYSFHYMYLTHSCISEFLETGEISELNIINLKSIFIDNL
jgi:hypothetical protein